jgi:hypothetical protein
VAAGAKTDSLAGVGGVWCTSVIIPAERIDIDEKRLGGALTGEGMDRWHSWKS